MKSSEFPEIDQLYLRKAENYNEPSQGLSAAARMNYKRKEGKNSLILLTSLIPWLFSQLGRLMVVGRTQRWAVEFPISFCYFCSLLFHSFIPYPRLSSASSISHPPHVSLKGLLFFSILVSCLGSSLISISTASFPSGFICSLFLPFLFPLLF